MTWADAEVDADESPGAQDRRARRELLRRARAYAMIMPPDAFFVGRTAAVIHGVPADASGDLEVAVIAPARAPRVRGVRSRQVRRHLAHRTDVEGLAVASPASVWAMLGREQTVRELVVMGDAMVKIPRSEGGRRYPARALTTVEALKRATQAGRRSGATRLLEALTHIRVGSSSSLESEFRMDAAAAGLPEPELDVEIRDPSGRLVGISEIVYPEYRVAVEVEGDQHRTSRAQWNRDIEKYASYAALGWEVVRVTSKHVRARHPLAVSMVRAALIRHGWRS